MNLRVRLQPTDRTDVICICCLQFRSDKVIVRGDGTETDTGVHKKCAGEVAAKFTRQRRAA